MKSFQVYGIIFSFISVKAASVIINAVLNKIHPDILAMSA
jgi:hypothetical protein